MIPIEGLPLAIRPFVQETDSGYIISTWTNDSHMIYPAIKIPNSIYIPQQATIIENVLAKWGAWMLCIDDEPDIIVGYIVSQPVDEHNTIVFWANIKGIFRRNGYSNILLKHIEAEGKNLICPQHFKLFSKLEKSYHLISDPTVLERYK